MQGIGARYVVAKSLGIARERIEFFSCGESVRYSYSQGKS